MRLRPITVAVVIAIGTISTSTRAQQVGLSIGPIAPLGSFGEHRNTGIRAQASLFSPGGLFRADIAGVLIGGAPAPDVPAWRAGNWRDFSIAGSVLPVLSRSDAGRVRGLIGISAHRMSIQGTQNPYGVVPGLQLGGVLERAWRGHVVSLELSLHAVASDYGTDEWSGSFSIPVLVGFRW